MIVRAILAAVIALVAMILFSMECISRKYYPRPGFTLSMVPDQTSKVIIITGGTTGVGRVSAEQLCAKGAKLVVITSRSQKSADKAAEQIQQEHCSKRDHGHHQQQPKVLGKELVLEDYESVKRFAMWFRSLNEPLHVLMLNAGYATLDNAKTSLGMEKNVGVNWFGHFYLQQLLQDIIEKSAPSRIVIVSSGVVVAAPPLIKPLKVYAEGESSKESLRYAISKLFNIYHAAELHRRLREKGISNVYVNTLSPGLVATHLYDFVKSDDNFPFNYIQGYKSATEKGIEGGIVTLFIAFLADTVGLSPNDGALTQLYAATSPAIENLNISGEFFYPIARREDKSWYYFGTLSNLPPQARNSSLAKELWAYGETMISMTSKDS